MIKRENIKQAIDAISERDPEIGYSLNEMLGMGQIDVPSYTDKASQGDDLYFLFDRQEVPVKKFLFFNEGAVPIEQLLLIKYGEMIKKQEIQNREDSINYMRAAGEIRKAGLRLMVTHEIDYAIARLQKDLKKPDVGSNSTGGKPTFAEGVSDEFETRNLKLETQTNLISFLEDIKQDKLKLEDPHTIKKGETRPPVSYRGVVDSDTPAHFICLPFCMDSLMQVADMNLEFFHVRFLLNCLVRGLEKNLFICLAARQIVGLVYITLKERMFFKGLEIKFIATLRGKAGIQSESRLKAPKGVGALLVAGVWMLWKTEIAGISEISLDSEIGARRFYEAVGFQPRGLSEYVLRSPKGYLLKTILMMVDNYQDLREGVIKEIETLLKKQVKFLRKKAKNEKQRSAREAAIVSIKEGLKSRGHPQFAETAISALIKYKKKIPESEELIKFGMQYRSHKT